MRHFDKTSALAVLPRNLAQTFWCCCISTGSVSQQSVRIPGRGAGGTCDLDFDALVGTHATVEIKGREGIRSFDGIVTQARWAECGRKRASL